MTAGQRVEYLEYGEKRTGVIRQVLDSIVIVLDDKSRLTKWKFKTSVKDIEQ